MISFLDMARARSVEYLDYEKFPRRYVDIPYGDIPRETMDIFLPADGEGPFPVVLQVTGGGWIFGDKSMKKMEPMVQTVVERGYALASMNYSLSNEAKYPVQILQVKAAIRFLRKNAEQFRLDSEKIFLYGNSAGGYLVLMAGYTGEGDPFFDAPRPGQEGISSRVRAIADIYGVTGLSRRREKMLAVGLEPKYYTDTLDSTEGYFLGMDTRINPELTAAADVLNYIKKDYPPTIIQHGKQDHTVSIKGSYDLVEKLLSVNDSHVEFDWFDNLDHSDPYFKSEENTSRIIDFFNKYL